MGKRTPVQTLRRNSPVCLVCEDQTGHSVPIQARFLGIRRVGRTKQYVFEALESFRLRGKVVVEGATFSLSSPGLADRVVLKPFEEREQHGIQRIALLAERAEKIVQGKVKSNYSFIPESEYKAANQKKETQKSSSLVSEAREALRVLKGGRPQGSADPKAEAALEALRRLQNPAQVRQAITEPAKPKKPKITVERINRKLRERGLDEVTVDQVNLALSYAKGGKNPWEIHKKTGLDEKVVHTILESSRKR